MNRKGSVRYSIKHQGRAARTQSTKNAPFAAVVCSITTLLILLGIEALMNRHWGIGVAVAPRRNVVAVRARVDRLMMLIVDMFLGFCDDGIKWREARNKQAVFLDSNENSKVENWGVNHQWGVSH